MNSFVLMTPFSRKDAAFAAIRKIRMI